MTTDTIRIMIFIAHPLFVWSTRAESPRRDHFFSLAPVRGKAANTLVLMPV
jgi:hypothetical protein